MKKKNAFVLALLIPNLCRGAFSNETSKNTLIACEALKMRWAVRKICHAFKIHRRLVLAKTMYKAMRHSYSPDIVQIIAKHGNI